jgi:hypothetical protein
LLLGIRTESDSEIEHWLVSELLSWQNKYQGCPTAEIIARSGAHEQQQPPHPHRLSEATLKAIEDEMHAGLERPASIRRPLRLRNDPNKQ